MAVENGSAPPAPSDLRLQCRHWAQQRCLSWPAVVPVHRHAHAHEATRDVVRAERHLGPGAGSGAPPGVLVVVGKEALQGLLVLQEVLHHAH